MSRTRSASAACPAAAHEVDRLTTSQLENDRLQETHVDPPLSKLVSKDDDAPNQNHGHSSMGPNNLRSMCFGHPAEESSAAIFETSLPDAIKHLQPGRHGSPSFGSGCPPNQLFGASVRIFSPEETKDRKMSSKDRALALPQSLDSLRRSTAPALHPLVEEKQREHTYPSPAGSSANFLEFTETPSTIERNVMAILGYIRRLPGNCPNHVIVQMAKLVEPFTQTKLTFDPHCGRYLRVQDNNKAVVRDSGPIIRLGGSVAVSEFPVQARQTSGHFFKPFSMRADVGEPSLLALTNMPAGEIANILTRESESLWKSLQPGQTIVELTPEKGVFISTCQERKLVLSHVRRSRERKPRSKMVDTFAVCEHGCLSSYIDGDLEEVVRPDEEFADVLRDFFQKDVFGLVDLKGQAALIRMTDSERRFDSCCQ